ncbi:MAG TPA: hypothetical protein VF550_16815, partial [Polyangia bacterium]
MTPKNLAAIPAALEVAGDTSALDLAIGEFIDSRWSSRRVAGAIATVARILRIGRVSGLCTSEAESLLTNRFSPDIARQVLEDLWDWLNAHAVGPGPRLADARNERDVILHHEVEDRENADDYDDDDDNDDDDDDDDDGPNLLATIGDEPDSPASIQGRHSATPLQPRESLPAIEAPPTDGTELASWVEKYGVKDRLADPLDLDHLHRSYYGFTIQGLPATIREAMLVTQTSITAPRLFRANLASEIAGMAKAYLHRAAQAVAFAHRRQTDREARTRPLDNPLLLRLEVLIRQQHDRLATENKPRAAGTFLPGRIFLSADPPALSYREWNINEGRTPTIEGQTMFCLHLSAWESGSLRLECMRCRQPLTCPHAVTALHEIIEALHDPADPLAATLVQILRVPGWSRLLERLDTGLSKIAGVPVEGQRLVWEIVRKNNNLAVCPVLQRLGKRGTWGRGQRLKLDELERHQELLREVSDREAFEGLMYSYDNHAYYYSAREQTPRQLWRALAALTGSTRVFSDPARSLPISVRKVRPALSVDTGDDGFHLRLALGPAEIEPMALLSSATDGRHVVFLDAEHSRCLLALLEPETTALLKAMASFPVTLPAEGLAEFVARLPRLQSALDLHLPESVRGERVEPPTTTLCRLEPLPEAGVRLDMAVRPIASGPVFPPGEGTPEVLHARDGRHLHALRALGAERERAAHLAQVLGLDDATANGDWRWDVSDDGVALDMLHKLRGLPELAEVEWPAGEIRVDHASRAALKVQVQRRRDWFGVEGEIEIDGARVPLSELLAAARAGRRFVRLNAHHFAKIEEELHQRLAALDDVVFDNKGAIELGLLAAPVLAELVEDGSQLDMVPAFRAVLG